MKLIGRILLVVCVLALFVGGLVGCKAKTATQTPAPTVTATPTPKPIEWKMQSAFVDKDLSTDLSARGLAKAIEQATNGRLRITVYPEGTLCSADEIFDYLKRGVFEMSVSVGAYHSDIAGPVTMLEGLVPYAWSELSVDKELYQNRGLQSLMVEVYAKQNVHFLGAAPSGSYGLFGNFQVNKVEDFKGKKIRSSSTYAKLLSLLGASVVNLPGAEQYMALKLGTVDGSLWSTAEVGVLKLYEVAKYYIKPALGIYNASIYVNMDAWKSLPDDIRKTVQEQNDKLSFGELAEKYLATEVEAMKTAQAAGMQIVTIPDSEVVKMRAIAMPLWDEYAKADQYSARFIKILKDYYGMK